MKIAVTSTVLFDVAEQSLDQIARDFRRANELIIGVPMKTVTGQLYIMTAIVLFQVTDASDRRPTFTCPRCSRTSHNPNDVANRYCGACHRFFDS